MSVAILVLAALAGGFAAGVGLAALALRTPPPGLFDDPDDWGGR